MGPAIQDRAYLMRQRGQGETRELNKGSEALLKNGLCLGGSEG